jgi:hypothetical protein
VIRFDARTIAIVAALACLAAAVACDSDRPPRWSQPSVPGASATAATPARAAGFAGWSDPARVGKPYGEKVPGLLTFRGNPTRTYYGTGPIPRGEPDRRWQYPESGGLCGKSSDAKGERVWCGTGWTGQPAVFERDGRTWVVFGAYDYGIHFLDAETGRQLLPTFRTGDIIKGSVTVDPDGYPLVYSGSRDNYFRILAVDRGRPTELWKLSATAVSPTMWNNDWDGAALVIDDYLFLGGENSQFHIVKLNRSYGSDGRVRVRPKLVFNAPGWDSQLLRDLPDENVSIENSVTVVGDTVYFANSGGLVQGWDIGGLKDGRKPERVFRFWTGDDTDATIVADESGALYVGVEYERRTERSRQVGQLLKLDPSKPGDPVVWSIGDRGGLPAGVWGTPALYRDIAIFDTTGGDVLGVDRSTGDVRWKLRTAGGQTWQSPVVVDGVLVIGDCTGFLHAYNVADTYAAPTRLWSKKVGGCVESTPAVWKGRLYFGTRAGAVMSLGAG